MSLLYVDQLSLRIGDNAALRDVSFSLREGECRALVGESGSGKSLTALCLLGLAPRGSQLSARQLRLAEDMLPAQGSRQWQSWRGRRVAMIFQNPMTALNPTRTIGAQLGEVFCLHRGMTRKQAKQASIALLERLAIPRAEARLSRYPFEFSGGMLQRVMIALAVACQPQLLIADEPTTALDVTIQAQILELMKDLTKRLGASLIIITHNLGVVARYADRVNVMYAGRIIEMGTAQDIYHNPRHPYTKGLLAALPAKAAAPKSRLNALGGQVPSIDAMPPGCRFANRCDHATPLCQQSAPPMTPRDNGAEIACHHWRVIDD